jgi:hypothetical protein
LGSLILLAFGAQVSLVRPSLLDLERLFQRSIPLFDLLTC